MSDNLGDFSSIFSKQLKPAQGMLLLAEPFMEGPEFKRSVVLLTEHGQKGSMGFIINRKLNVSPTQAIDEFPAFEDTLNYGGPVSSDQLFYLHTLGTLLEGSVEVMPGLYIGGDFEQLKSLIDTKQISPSQIRFFAGYAGWTANQLTKEIKENSWIVTPARIEYLFSDKDNKNLWKEVLRSMGGKHSMVAEFPEDPTLN
jgi:putative transcriptional regulator